MSLFRNAAFPACTLLTLLLVAASPVQEATAQPRATATPAAVKAVDATAPQPDVPPKVWMDNIGEQSRRLLEEPGDVRQDGAMLLIVQYADRPELAASFHPALPRLFEIYESDDVNAGRRLLALAALNAVGGPSVMKRLAENARAEADEEVYRHTLNVLAAHQQ